MAWTISGTRRIKSRPDGPATGVPAGTTLQRVPDDITSGLGWHWNTGGWVTVDGSAAVVDGLQVNGGVDVTGQNVTVQNSLIQYMGGGGATFGVSIRHGVNTTVQHCTISGPLGTALPPDGTDVNRLTAGVKDIFFDSTGTQVLDCDIFDCSCGVQIISGLIEGNFIHDLANNGTDHVNCVLSEGSNDLTIRGNTLLNRLSQNSCIALYSQEGPSNGATVTGNFLGGGGYCIYGADFTDGGQFAGTNIAITDNNFTAQFFPNGGEFGVLAKFDPSAIGNVFSGNTWADGPNLGREVVLS